MVVHNGCRIFVNIHDAEYLRQRTEWRRKLFSAHSDHGGTDAKLDKTVKAFRKWEAQEAAWYQRLHLSPPKSSEPETLLFSQPEVTRLLALAAGPRAKRIAVAMAMAKRPDVTSQTLSERFGISRNAAAVLLARVRRKPPTRATSGPVSVLWTLLDGLPHTAEDIARVCGIAKPRVAVYVSRLRRRGFSIETRFIRPHTYKLLSFLGTPTEGTWS